MNSQFIASLIQNVPIPAIHLCEAYHVLRSRKMWINDGGHRLRCIYQYCKNMWPIRVKNKDNTVSNVYYDSVPNQPGDRVSFTPATKLQVLQAQKFSCNCCKTPIHDGHEFDHIVPRWKGGSTADDNCQALCKKCHSNKTKQEATQRSKQVVGSLCDRVMTDKEKHMLLHRNVPVLEYGDYNGDALTIQREIFDRVQISATINVNDYISSHTSDPLVVHTNKQLDDHNSPLSRTEAVVDELSTGSNDWWSSIATTENTFAYVVALFTSLVTTTRRTDGGLDLYKPEKANKLSDAECQKEWKSNATKDQLRVFDKVLDAVCDVLASKKVHRIQYTDFAVLCHCFNRWGTRWTELVASMDNTTFDTAIENWQSTALTGDMISEKMGTLGDEAWKPNPCYKNHRKRAR